MLNAKHKNGRRLEKAVGFIQETILKSDPQLTGLECKVDFNKILTIDGVRHEVDVLVKTAVGSNYEATWIFECKNWSKPVGKKEIADFADKVAATGANRGFFVAKALSQFAEARLNQDKRLRFIPWTDKFESPLNHLEAVHTTFDPVSRRLTIAWQEIHPDNPTELQWDKMELVINNAPVLLSTFIEQHVAQFIKENQKASITRYREASCHWVELKKQFEFNSGECVINKLNVREIVLNAIYWVKVRRHQVSSKFELKNQGRVFSIDIVDDDYPQDSIEIRILQRV